MMLVCVFMVALVVEWTSSCSVASSRRGYHHFSTCGAHMVLKPENRFKEITAMSALHCGLLCASHVDCKSFDYDPDLAACYLGSVAVGTNCTEHMLPQAGSAAQHFAQGQLCTGGRDQQTDLACQCPPAFNGHPHCHHRMQDCTDWYKFTKCDGIQWVWPFTANAPFQVYCDQMTLKARTVLMKRRGGGENFLREMEDYSRGFGELSQEHWLGLRYMHLLTSNRRYQLKFSMKMGNLTDTTFYVLHSDVYIGSESLGFPLTLNPMKPTNNTLLDCLYPHLIGVPFSAKLQDKDLDDSKTCWQLFGGGWWFNGTADCSLCNPTGSVMLSAGEEGSGASDEVHWSTTGSSGKGLAPHTIVMFLLPEY